MKSPRTLTWCAAALFALTLSLGGQELTWSLSADTAVNTAVTTGKPLLLHYVAGPQAANFAQELDRLWSTWPEWSQGLAVQTVPLRIRSWEGALPSNLPTPPANGKSSFLALWVPGAATWVVSWQAVPSVLELSHSLQRDGHLALGDPYQTDVVAFEVDDPLVSPHRFDREAGGPGWTETWGTTTRLWKEEGPLGSLLILKDTASTQKLAFPFESDWSFASAAATQSWSPWFRVTVVRR